MYYIFILFLFCVEPSSALSGTGPYEIVPHSVSDCSDRNGKFKIKASLKKINSTLHSLNGESWIKEEINNDVEVTVTAAQRTNRGTFKENFLNRNFGPVCTAMTTFLNDLSYIVAKHLGLKKRCPYPVGNYTFQNLPLDVSVPQIPVFAYGFYRLKVILEKKNKPFACISILGDCIPRKIKF